MRPWSRRCWTACGYRTAIWWWSAATSPSARGGTSSRWPARSSTGSACRCWWSPATMTCRRSTGRSRACCGRWPGSTATCRRTGSRCSSTTRSPCWDWAPRAGSPARTGGSRSSRWRRSAHVLGELPERLFKVLVTHHPLAVPMLAAPLQMVGRARRALDAVADAGVHLLLSGHYHRWASGEAPAQVTRQRSVLVVACRHRGLDPHPRRRGQQLQPGPARRRAARGRGDGLAAAGRLRRHGTGSASCCGASGWIAAPAVAMGAAESPDDPNRD